MDSVATFLQIDLQNLFLSSNHGQKLDLEKIWDHINARETEFLTGAVIYTVRSPEFDSNRFETKLKTVGYEVRTKNLPRLPRRGKYQRSTPHESPVNLDILITMECLLKKDLFNKWILITNNGAYADLCKYLRDIGKKIEIWSFRESYDPSLELYADKMHFLDEDFCLKKPNISVFGINWGLEKFDSTAFWGRT